MNTFLLIVTLILLIMRVLSTPISLSKKEYKKYIKDIIKSREESFSKKNEEELQNFKFVSQILFIILNTFIILYYLHIGSIFSNKIIYFMSTIQVSMGLVYFWKDFRNLSSTNPEDFEFVRCLELFNVILDYIYYPLVIYMLLLL